VGWGRPRGVCAVEFPRLGLAGVLSTCKHIIRMINDTNDNNNNSNDDFPAHDELGTCGPSHCVIQGKGLLTGASSNKQINYSVIVNKLLGLGISRKATAHA